MLIWMPCTLPALASASEFPKEILVPSSADHDLPTALWTRRTEVREGAHLSLIGEVFNLSNVDNLTGDSGGLTNRMMISRGCESARSSRQAARACSSASVFYSGD